jgi:hypothetical protein
MVLTNMSSFAFPRPLTVLQALIDWHHTKKLTSDEFKKLTKENGIVFGTSVSITALEDLGLAGKKLDETLTYLVTALGIKHLRLGIRWDKISVSEQNQFDFTKYTPLFDWLTKNCKKYNLSITLNLGPVKVFRWPEQHVPTWVLENYGIPKKLTSESDIAVQAKKHLVTLSHYLEEQYPEVLACTDLIQLENELFNPFGENETIADFEYINSLFDCLPFSWLTKRFLWNGSGLYDAQSLSGLIEHLHNVRPSIKHRIGIDYYYTQDKFYKQLWTRVFDHVALFPFGVSSPKLTREFKKFKAMGIDVDREVTEAQFEDWGRAKHPGSSLSELAWVVIRCLRYKPVNSDRLVISLWGIERYLARVLGAMKYSYPFTTLDDLNIEEFLNSQAK